MAATCRPGLVTAIKIRMKNPESLWAVIGSSFIIFDSHRPDSLRSSSIHFVHLRRSRGVPMLGSCVFTSHTPKTNSERIRRQEPSQGPPWANALLSSLLSHPACRQDPLPSEQRVGGKVAEGEPTIRLSGRTFLARQWG